MYVGIWLGPTEFFYFSLTEYEAFDNSVYVH